MTSQVQTLEALRAHRASAWTLSRRRMALRIFGLAVMVIYSVFTIFPFYMLFVRSFVATADAGELHLWIPKARPVDMNIEVGNLSVFYNLDLKVMKEALGIPKGKFLGARETLAEIAKKYNIPEERIRSYFEGFYLFNGWQTLLFGQAGGSNFWAALIRTILVAFVSLGILIVLSIFTGYGLAGLRRRDQMYVYNLYLLQMVIPAMLIILPQYQMFQWFFKLFPGYDVQNSFLRHALQLLAVILINIKGTALSTMIFVSAISGIPRDLEESAMLDGASRWQYLWHILFPLLKVPIVSLTVIQLPLFYNQFLEPYVYLDPANTTLLPFIANTAGQFSTNFQVIYSGVFASILPLLVVYLIFRRFFVEGVMAGAIKG
jgi:ABC-type glycerol-3-phosphate transport system permease component